MSDEMRLCTLSQRRRLRRILLWLGVFVVFGLFLRALLNSTPTPRGRPPSGRPPSGGIPPTSFPIIPDISLPPPPPKVFVVASMEKDDSTWIQEYLPDWTLIRYLVDSPTAQYHVPMNKGREAMVYLTYIIDHYDNLSDVMVFMHSERYQWHNDDPLYDGATLLQNLQIPYIISQGYVNLRCVWTLGCPSELKLTEIVQQPSSDLISATTTAIAYPDAFKELFPGEPLPDVVGVACCAQFALSRQKIRERPIEDYQRYRTWIMETSLDDHVSGRVLEYSWHLIFGRKAVHCPIARDCYCKTYGLCDLECEDEGRCGERWPFPPYSTLPDGWPAIGWDGETRSPDKLGDLRRTAVKGNGTLI